jgi:predicted ATP-grasp superfamily ATP-dependent carboligase
LGADLFADADLKFGGPWRQITDYPAGLAWWLDQTECDGWMFTGGLENYPAQVAAMAAQRPLLGCGGEVLQKVRSPGRLAAVLEAAGLRFPKTLALPTVDPVPFTETAGRWLVKTSRGSSGMGVRPLAAPLTDQARSAQARSAPTDLLNGDCYLQQRIDGSPCSALFLARAGQAELLGLTRQLVGEPWTGAAPFQYCGSIGPHPWLPAGVSAQVKRIGAVLAKTFGLVGLFGVDLIRAGSQVWTIEVNPRYTAAAEVVERVSGMPVLGRHIRACQQQAGEQELVGEMDRPSRAVPAAGYHGKAVLFAQQPVAVSGGFTRWALESPCRAGWPQLADIPWPGTVIRASQPVVTLLAAGDSAAQVEGTLRERVAETRRKLYG